MLRNFFSRDVIGVRFGEDRNTFSVNFCKQNGGAPLNNGKMVGTTATFDFGAVHKRISLADLDNAAK